MKALSRVPVSWAVLCSGFQLTEGRGQAFSSLRLDREALPSVTQQVNGEGGADLGPLGICLDPSHLI